MRPYTRYCNGFLFDGDKVLLIQKKRPAWQAGKLNGIGGHIEDGETPVQALVREFEEETGLVTEPDQWIEFVGLNGAEFTVHFFASQGSHEGYESKTDELVFPIDVSDLNIYNHVHNLAWLIPAARLALQRPSPRLLVWEQREQ